MNAVEISSDPISDLSDWSAGSEFSAPSSFDEHSLESPLRKMLNTHLGAFYFLTHLHSPPSFLQIIGWTRTTEMLARSGACARDKKVHVYIRKVPLRISNSPSGGYWKFDEKVIDEYSSEIKEPTMKPKDPYADTAIISLDGLFLRYSGYNIPLHSVTAIVEKTGIPIKKARV